ncbi:unnamed protein product [Brassica oleracea var. botrytis]
MVSSSQPKFVIWICLCDLCSMWRYLLDLFLVLCGYGIWFLDEAVDLFFSSSLARRWAVFVL